MQWFHLPIRDVCVPCGDFESEWIIVGEALRAILRSGFDIVVHCKGGLGRAGMVAARLLVEPGQSPEDAIAAVRAARPGAVETPAQAAHVANQTAHEEPKPSTSSHAVRDRGIGALLGLAVGDAIGTTLEFKQRDSYAPLTDMIGGGPFRLQAGQWTDDTAMALALADSLLELEEFDEADLMRRFIQWRDEGAYSCTNSCFDIGLTVSSALRGFEMTGNPIAGSTDPNSAGNGSLMRLAPAVLRYWRDRAKLQEIAARQSVTTHGAPEAISACTGFALLLATRSPACPAARCLKLEREITLRGSSRSWAAPGEESGEAKFHHPAMSLILWKQHCGR